MKYAICLLITLGMMPFSFGQRFEYGEKFPFDAVSEKDPTFVLEDNYNTYLFTVLNQDGMMARHEMILRKFDQKNKLTETLVYKFPAFDPATLFDYLGFTEGSNGKLAVFTKTYSKKALKSVIYKHEFDKATAKFTSTELFSTPIVSNSKSGDVQLVKSESGYFTGINYKFHKEKEAPEKNHMIVLDNNLNLVWQKDFEFTDKYVTKTFAVTPSGKIAYLRNASGWKTGNYLVYATAEGMDVKNLETEIILQEPHTIAIGSQEYILAFNHPAKGLRGGSFNNLLLFDLQSGKTVNNIKIPEVNNGGNLEDVLMRHISVQNNEIHLFTEGMIEVKTPPGSGPGLGQPGFMEKIYNYGPSNLVILNADGTLKSAKKLNVDEQSRAKIYHSFGLINIRETYWLNTGFHGGMYPLNVSDKYNKDSSRAVNFIYKSDPQYNYDPKYMPQLMAYFPDSNKILLAKTTDNNTQLSLVSVLDIKP